jgi:hydroxyacylglutathione hydrolase
MFKFKKFTGGVFETNAFFVPAPGGNLLFDAPQGAAAAFKGEKIGMLVLTHGHFDHVVDAAQILREHQCPCVIASDSLPLVTTADAFTKYGFALEIEPFQPDTILSEGKGKTLLGMNFDIYEVPGHCPGSLCFYQPESGHLIGGDVLFAGGVGRWDLPGGDADLLFRGIREKLFPLPDDTVVHPGHGPDTTIGAEKASNPFVRP